MKRLLTICTVLGSILFLVTVTKAAEFNGAADNERDDLGYYYAITGGKFPTGNIPNGDNASGGTFRWLSDDPSWGDWSLPINVWHKDDWFPENASLALTMKSDGNIVYDNNGIETDTTVGFYDEDTNSNLAGLYRGYAMSNNWDWIYAGYFKLDSETTIDTIIGYFDANAGFDPDNPNIAYRMNIWSSFQDNPGGNPNSYMPVVASFTGDIFSTDSTAGTFSWSDTGIDRFYSGWPYPYTDDILRLVFVLDEPITLSAGEYFFSHDAILVEPNIAAVATEKAKVCWHHDDLHVEGNLSLPEGVWMDTLSPVGSAVITLAGVEVTDPEQSVEFEIKGKKDDKWKYKDKDNVYGNIKEFKIDWKGAKFDYKGDNKFHMHTHFIATETTFCIHTGDVSGAFTVTINGTAIAYDEERSITTNVGYEVQKDDNSHVHFTLPFQLTSDMTIGVSRAIELTINVADYYDEEYAKFKVVSAFDSGLFPDGPATTQDTLEYVITLGNDTNMTYGSDLINSWTKKNDKHWEYK